MKMVILHPLFHVQKYWVQYWEDKANNVGAVSHNEIQDYRSVSQGAVGGPTKKRKGRCSDWNITPFLIRTDLDEKDYLLNSLVIAAA